MGPCVAYGPRVLSSRRPSVGKESGQAWGVGEEPISGVVRTDSVSRRREKNREGELVSR